MIRKYFSLGGSETPLIYQTYLLREYQTGDYGHVHECGQRGHKKGNR